MDLSKKKKPPRPTDGFLLSENFRSLKCLGWLSSLTGSKSILRPHCHLLTHCASSPSRGLSLPGCSSWFWRESIHPSCSPGNRHVVEETFSVSYRCLWSSTANQMSCFTLRNQFGETSNFIGIYNPMLRCTTISPWETLSGKFSTPILKNLFLG